MWRQDERCAHCKATRDRGGGCDLHAIRTCGSTRPSSAFRPSLLEANLLVCYLHHAASSDPTFSYGATKCHHIGCIMNSSPWTQWMAAAFEDDGDTGPPIGTPPTCEC